MTISLLKGHWVFTLNNCIIAGGFIRDSLLGNPVSDIDIYIIPENEIIVYKQIRNRIANESKLKIALANRDMSNYSNVLDIQKIRKFNTWRGEKIDLIISPEASTIDGILNSFDYTINTIGWSHDEGLIGHKNFLVHLWNRRLVPINDRTISPEREKHMRDKGFK